MAEKQERRLRKRDTHMTSETGKQHITYLCCKCVTEQSLGDIPKN